MKLLLLIILIQTHTLFAQPVLSPQVLTAKQTEKQRLTKSIKEAFTLPINNENGLAYESALWAMLMLEYKPTEAITVIKKGLQDFTLLEPSLQNSLLETVYALYPKDFEKEILNLVSFQFNNLTPKQFAVCGEYLYNVNPKKHSKMLKNICTDAFLKNLDNVSNQLYFGNLSTRIINRSKKWDNKNEIAFLSKIVNNQILPNKNVIISVQNKNRDYPGIVIIRDSAGKIVLQNDTIMYTQQLARAVTNLPFYISNGNTPQGIFRINGLGVSKNSQIGPTENFQLCMPFECKVSHFFDEQINDTVWSPLLYESIYTQTTTKDLNPFAFLNEAAHAGQVGRFEIIAHGTAVNTEYYKGKPYFGFTPTAGCLQAKEIWDYKTGQRIYSDQQKLVDAYKSIGATKSYLIVLDIIDEKRPVTINDVKKIVKQK
jgi:hypothetical protein